MHILIMIPILLVIAYFFSRRLLPSFSKIDRDNYRNSYTWKLRCIRTKLRDKHTCQMCSSTTSLEVHHITYVRFRHEHNDDLITLCTSCHKKIHKEYGYNYTSIFPLIKDRK